MSDSLSPRDIRRDMLFDYAVEHPDGFTKADAMNDLEWGSWPKTFNDAVRDLRVMMGDSDSINLIADPQGSGEQWLYRLVGTVDEGREWVTNRVGDVEGRIRTLQAVVASAVSGSDGRSIEGRKARILHRGISRIVEDLDELVAAAAMNGQIPFDQEE